METKRCSKCKERKFLEEFTKDSHRKDGKRTHCKKCCNEYYRSEKRKLVKKRFYEKRKNDPNFRLRNVISCAIRDYLRKRCSGKNSSIMKYLPYTIEQLKEHLESQFEDWMSWENYGNSKSSDDKKFWNIDHIIPQSFFNFISLDEEEFQKCWSLQNLRPLDSRENICKGNKLIL